MKPSEGVELTSKMTSTNFDSVNDTATNFSLIYVGTNGTKSIHLETAVGTNVKASIHFKTAVGTNGAT